MSGMLSAGGNRIAVPELGEAALATLAHRDAMRHIAQDIPDPEDYAARLPATIVELLLSTRRAGFIAYPQTALALQKWGLAEAGTKPRYLTAFGLQVRKILRGDDE